jgi:hypothetical protein
MILAVEVDTHRAKAGHKDLVEVDTHRAKAGHKDLVEEVPPQDGPPNLGSVEEGRTDSDTQKRHPGQAQNADHPSKRTEVARSNRPVPSRFDGNCRIRTFCVRRQLLPTDNVTELQLLGNEFGFDALNEQLAAWIAQHPPMMSRLIIALQNKTEQQEATIQALSAGFADLRQRLEEQIPSLHDQITFLKEEMRMLGVKRFPPGNDPLEGIIAYLTRQCGGNVSDHQIVNATGSRASWGAPRNVADLTANSGYGSIFRGDDEAIPHERNNWIRYEFRDRKIIPTHYSIRSAVNGGRNGANLRNWLIETSMDGEHWTEVDHRENNSELNARDTTRRFRVARCQLCRFIQLVNIGRNHRVTERRDQLAFSSWEILGSLVE